MEIQIEIQMELQKEIRMEIQMHIQMEIQMEIQIRIQMHKKTKSANKQTNANFHIWKCQCTNIKFNGSQCQISQTPLKNWYINANSSKDDKTKDFGLLDVDRQHPVGGGEDGGGDGEAESQGTCIPIFF